jgi:hypothetical protein
VAISKYFIFIFFKKEFLGRISNLEKKEQFIKSLGPLFIFRDHFKIDTK